MARKGLTVWHAGSVNSLVFYTTIPTDPLTFQILRKLARKYGLSRQKGEKGTIYVEDLAVIMLTNLTTTKKKYTHGRHRIQLALFLQLAGFSANRPQAVLNLCYRHIIVTLLRDPNGGPHNILMEFTYEFTKEFLGTKEMYAVTFHFTSDTPSATIIFKDPPQADLPGIHSPFPRLFSTHPWPLARMLPSWVSFLPTEHFSPRG